MNRHDQIEYKRLKINILKSARQSLICLPINYMCGICRSIDMVPGTGSRGREAKRDLTEYIRKALNKSPYLWKWVYFHTGGRKGFLRWHDRNDTDDAALRLTRLAWIDWMVQCLEEDIAKLKGT